MEWVRSVTVEEDKIEIELLLKSGGYGGGFVWLLAAVLGWVSSSDRVWLVWKMCGLQM